MNDAVTILVEVIRSSRMDKFSLDPAAPARHIPPMKTLPALLLLTLAACAPPAPTSPTIQHATVNFAPAATEAPAGSYALDRAHASLLFRVDHIGFSKYTGRFTDFDARLDFDPANPARMALTATVDPRSLTLDNPPPGFEAELRGVNWLDAGRFPEMTFRSTAVQLTAPNAARVTGDFTLHGVTRPVTLDVTFNGGYAGHPMDPRARVGFSAKGVLKRTEFGIAYGVPAPGTKMGVSDDVDIILEAEFTGPPLAGAAKK